MKDLIARLEAATEGSRELDAVIRKAIGIRATNEDKLTPEQIESHHRTFAPAYTTSIDAALTLVPDHIECGTIKFSRNKTGRQYCHATLEQSAESLGRDMRDDEPLEIEASNVATLPLACCIAALKARQP